MFENQKKRKCNKKRYFTYFIKKIAKTQNSQLAKALTLFTVSGAYS